MAKIVKATVELDISDAVSQAKKLGAELRASLKSSIGQAGNITGELAKLSRALNAVTDSTRKSNRVTKERVQTAEQAARATHRRAIEVQKLAKATDQAALAAKRLKQADDVKEEPSLFDRGLTRVGSVALQQVAQLIVSGLAKIGSEFASVVREAIAFETQFTNVIKTVDGATEALADGSLGISKFGEGLRTSLLTLTRDLPATIQEITEVATVAGQLGVPAAEIEKFVSVMTKLGATTNLGAEQAATALAKFRNVVGLSFSDLENLGSAIVFLGNNFATTEKEITTFVQRIAGVSSVSKLSAEDISADLAGIATAFSAAGQSSTAASTAIQKVFLQIAQAVQTGGEKLEGFAATAGLSSESFAELFQTDSTEAFVRFVEGLGDAGDEAFTILEGLELADSRLIRSFLTVASSGDLLRDSIEASNKAFSENIALNQEAGLRFETTASKIDILKNAYRELKVTYLENTDAIADGVDALSASLNLTTDAIRLERELAEARQATNDVLDDSDLNQTDGRQFIGEGGQNRDPNSVGRREDLILAKELVEVRRALGQIETPEDGIAGGQLDEVQRLAAEIDILNAVTELTARNIPITTEAVRQFAFEAIAGGVSVAELVDNIERMNIVTDLARNLDVTQDVANTLIDAIAGNKKAFEQLSAPVQDILTKLPEFSSLAVDMSSAVAEDVNQLGDLKFGLREAGNATSELSLQFLLNLGLTEELASEILGLIDPTSEFGIAAEQAAERADRLVENHTALIELTGELAKSYLESGTAIDLTTTKMIDQAIAAGATQTELTALIESSGAFSEAELEVIANTVQLERETNALIEEYIAGNITIEEATAELLKLSQSMNLTTLTTEELAAATSELVTAYLDTSNAADSLVIKIIEQAEAAGATSDQILDLAEATGSLSEAELNTVRSTLKFRQEQARLFEEVRRGRTTFAEAAVTLLAYADSLNIATNASIGLAATTSTFASSLDGVTASAGGASGAAKETEKSFRDLFVGVVQGIGDFDEFGDAVAETTEDWAESLLDVAINAGASINQIIALAAATGLLTEEQTAQLLNLAILERGIESIADQYVNGEISAEMAAGAVKGLSEQVAAGAEIDLSEFGVSFDDLTTKAGQAERAVGGAGKTVETFRSQLISASEDAGATSEELIGVARATGELTEAQIKQALTQDSTNRLVETYGKLIADGFNAERAVSEIDAIKAGLESLSVDQIGDFLDGAIELNLSPTDFLESINTFLDAEGKLTVEASIEATVADIETPDEIRLKAKVEVSDIEIPDAVTIDVTPTISGGVTGLFEDADVFTVDADATAVSDAIDETVSETRVIAVDADTSDAEGTIQANITDADYEISVDADISEAQLALADLTERIEVEIVANVTTNVSNSSTGDSGGSGPIMREGGLISGDSHELGGVDINAEGGEFVVSKKAVTPATEPLLRAINNGNFGESISGSLGDMTGLFESAFAGFGTTNTVTMPDILTGQTGVVPSGNKFDQRSSIDQSTTTSVVNNITNVSQRGDNQRVTSTNDFARL